MIWYNYVYVVFKTLSQNTFTNAAESVNADPRKRTNRSRRNGPNFPAQNR